MRKDTDAITGRIRKMHTEHSAMSDFGVGAETNHKHVQRLPHSV